MTDDDGFIGLPPGITPNPDSGTLRRDRAERPRRERDEIVFFPAAPGVAPPVLPVEAEPAVAETNTETNTDTEVADPPADTVVAEPTVAAPVVPPGTDALVVDTVIARIDAATIDAETVVPGAPPSRPGIDDATRVKPSRRAAPTWRLVIDGREPVIVEGALYLGRKPVAGAEHPQARLLVVDDEARSVSKTHALLEVDSGALWVHDLHSTNGVWVVPAGEDAIEVTPGERAPVPAGSELELGDLVIQVEHG